MKEFLDYETIHEMDDGPGQVIGFHLEGHVSLEDVELWLADGEVLDEHGMYETGDWDVVHTYVGQSSVGEDGEELDSGYFFVYSKEPRPSYRAVTKLEPGWFTSHWCVVHPMEPYSRAVPAESFVDEHPLQVLSEEDMFGHGRRIIYLCALCTEGYDKRYKEAYAQAMIELEFEKRAVA